MFSRFLKPIMPETTNEFRLERQHDGTYEIQRKTIWNSWKSIYDEHMKFTYEEAKRRFDMFAYKPVHLYEPLPEQEPNYVEPVIEEA